MNSIIYIEIFRWKDCWIINRVTVKLIQKIINKCIEINIFPDTLKMARMIPVYKKGDPNDLITIG